MFLRAGIFAASQLNFFSPEPQAPVQEGRGPTQLKSRGSQSPRKDLTTDGTHRFLKFLPIFKCPHHRTEIPATSDSPMTHLASCLITVSSCSSYNHPLQGHRTGHLDAETYSEAQECTQRKEGHKQDHMNDPLVGT